jgi:hypothetical protein
MVRFIIALNLVNKEDVDYVKSRKTSLSANKDFVMGISEDKFFKVDGFKVFNLTDGVIENIGLKDAFSEDSGIEWETNFDEYDFADGYIELNCFGGSWNDVLMFSYGYELLDIYPNYFYLYNCGTFCDGGFDIGVSIDLRSEEFCLYLNRTLVYGGVEMSDSEPVVFIERFYKISIESDLKTFYRPVSSNSYVIGDAFVIDGSDFDDLCIMPQDCKKCIIGCLYVEKNINVVLHPNVEEVNMIGIDNSCKVKLFISKVTADKVIHNIVSGYEYEEKVVGAIDYLKDYNVYIELY